MKMTAPPSKRLDLQGIRGLAILSVLGFHFFPQLFPNGYLGVDQFFVLSGFLMCMLLTKTQQMSPLSATMLFYSKRFKRILPLYLLIILLTLIALYTVFPETAVYQNEISARKALLFISNRPHTGEEDYFEKLSLAIDLFTHTWSLSVEIQFYVIVPFIFFVGNKFSERLKYGYYLIIGLASLVFYSLSPSQVAFNSVFARIWQFIIGMVIYMTSSTGTLALKSLPYTLMESENGVEQLKLLKEDDGFDESEDEEEKEEKKEIKEAEASLGPFSKYFFLLPMAYIVTYPIPLFANLLRPLFTVFTGILMLLSIDDAYLSNRYLTYIGDISYSLYLIHWPVLAYAKLAYPENPYVIFSSLVIAVLFSILIYETFEKWYLKLSGKWAALLIVFLFAASMALVNKDEIQESFQQQTPVIPITNSFSKFERLDGVTPNMTVDDAITKNWRWSKYDLEALIEPGCIHRTPKHSRWCDYQENGTEFKIAMFGSSYTKNHHKMLIQECRHRTYNISMDSERGCEPLAASSKDGFCKKKLEEFVQYIESAKPDYAFMFTRFFAVADPFEKNNTDLEKDKTYLLMRSQLQKFLPNIKKKLFILDSIPRANAGYIGKLAEDLKKGVPIETISKRVLQPDGYERGRLRHAALVKECEGKCELIDYMPLFWNSTTNMTQYFDNRGFSYFTSPNHLSAHGLELVRPIYRNICAGLE